MSLYGDIMNIPTSANAEQMPEALRLAYKYGHRDARHIAAEMVLRHERALEVAYGALSGLYRYDQQARDALHSVQEILKGE